MRSLSLIALCCLLLAGSAVRSHAQGTDWTKAEKAGPFNVTPGQWLDTGITVKRGQRFMVAATGTIKATDYPFTEIGPNGNGYYSLKGYLTPQNSNDAKPQFMVLGSQGGGAAQEDSTLKLGVTRSNYFAANPSHPEDQLYKGAIEVTVYLEKVEVHTAAAPRPITKGPVTLLKLTGDANYLKPGADWKEAFEGARLGPEDEIHTGPDSEVTLQFSDGSVVVLSQLTRIKMGGLLSQENRVKIELLLKMGELKSHVIRQDVVGADFSVKTPTATTSVRGTRFTTRYDETTQTSTIRVTEGSVLVSPTNTAHRPFMLKANQEVEVAQTSVGAVRPVGGARPAPVTDDISLGPATAATAPTITGGVLNGYTIKRVDPIYPAGKISGTVVVQVTIDEQGNVMSAQAISGHPLLKDSAVTAVKQWKFDLKELSQVPVKVKGTVNVVFTAR